MSSMVFTHIETVSKREGAKMWRAITGAGIYDVAPTSPVGKSIDRPEFSGPVTLAVAVAGCSSRIVGIATRDGAHKAGRITL